MLIRVSLVYSPAARQVFECHLELEQGATVRQAVEASGVLRAFPSLVSAPTYRPAVQASPADAVCNQERPAIAFSE